MDSQGLERGLVHTGPQWGSTGLVPVTPDAHIDLSYHADLYTMGCGTQSPQAHSLTLVFQAFSVAGQYQLLTETKAHTSCPQGQGPVYLARLRSGHRAHYLL